MCDPRGWTRPETLPGEGGMWGGGVTKTQPGWAGKDQPGKWTGTAYSVTQRQDALGENRHLPWGLLGAPLLDLQDSEPKVSNVVSTLRRMLRANRGKTQALPDQTHCLHLAAPGPHHSYTDAPGAGLVPGSWSGRPLCGL